MDLEISEKASIIIKKSRLEETLKDKLQIVIKEHPPLDSEDGRAILTDIEYVGVSFEPRYLLTYEIYAEKKQGREYQGTFVFDKNFDFVRITQEGWVDKSQQD